jgi:PKD repeat protein
MLVLVSLTLLSAGGVLTNSSLKTANASSGDPTNPITKIVASNITANVDDVIKVYVNVSDVEGAVGVSIWFWWDVTVLEYIDHTPTIPNGTTYPEGFLHPPVDIGKDEVNPTEGKYRLAAMSKAPAPGEPIRAFNGSGSVFFMEFKVLRNATAYLHFGYEYFPGTQLVYRNGSYIDHIPVDGKFSTPDFEDEWAPFANFTFQPDIIYVNRTEVTFNASGSFDPDELAGGYIKWYMWDFGDGTPLVNTSEPIVTHNYTKKQSVSVKLVVVDNRGCFSYPFYDGFFVQIYNDISIEKVTISPWQLLWGDTATIDVMISNLGDKRLSFAYVYVYYNETVIDWNNPNATRWVQIDQGWVVGLLPGENETVTFNWDTTSVISQRHYWVKANTSSILLDVNLTNNAKLSDASIFIKGIFPVANFINIPSRPLVNETVIFDASTSIDPDGNITLYEWDLGDGTLISTTNATIAHIYTDTGNYRVALEVTDNHGFTNSTTKYVQVVDVATYLDVDIDVGTIHFSGEKAEFYILITWLGDRVEASQITAVLYFNGSRFEDLTSKIEPITRGFYRITYTLPSTASSGTYTLLVEASYFNLKGTAIKSFLVSQTLTDWDPLLVDIKDEIATIIIPNLWQIKADLATIKATLVGIEGTVGRINSTVGEIRVNLDLINATITDIIVNSKGEVLAEINSTMGTITVKLDDLGATLTGIMVNSEGEIIAEIETVLEVVTTKLEVINGTISNIDGNVAIIETDIGEIKTRLKDLLETSSEVQTTASMSLYTASAFSAAATVLTFIILLLLRKRRA